MSAVADDLGRELRWLNNRRTDLMITREALGDVGWSNPITWADVRQEARSLHPLQRPPLRQLWRQLDGLERAAIARTVIGITNVELARMECLRALQLAGQAP